MKAGGVEYVILGALSLRPMSGYEIKQLVDRSTRFFWAASYGQIYPELRRLKDRGLVEAAEEPRGGRRRVVYRLSPAGSEALATWLREPPNPLELRDEGLLKLFFAGALEHDGALELVRSIRASWEEKLGRLHELGRSKAPTGFPALVLEFGIGMTEWMVEWSRTAEHRLQNEMGGTR
jgi:DNA-binding PadR family transcriptional regulator